MFLLDGRPITTTTENPLLALVRLRGGQTGGIGTGGGALAALARLRGMGGQGDNSRLAALAALAGQGGGQNLQSLLRLLGRGGGGSNTIGGQAGSGGGLNALTALLGTQMGATPGTTQTNASQPPSTTIPTGSVGYKELHY